MNILNVFLASIYVFFVILSKQEKIIKHIIFSVKTCVLYSQECDGNKYGPRCSLNCGACINNKQCNHINGSCLEGCSPGFYGQKCDKGALISWSYLNNFYYNIIHFRFKHSWGQTKVDVSLQWLGDVGNNWLPMHCFTWKTRCTKSIFVD